MTAKKSEYFIIKWPGKSMVNVVVKLYQLSDNILTTSDSDVETLAENFNEVDFLLEGSTFSSFALLVQYKVWIGSIYQRIKIILKGFSPCNSYKRPFFVVKVLH